MMSPIFTIFFVIKLVSNASISSLVSGSLHYCFVALMLTIREKWVIVKLLEGVLLDLLEREMSLIVDPHVLIALITRNIVRVRSELAVWVIMFKLFACRLMLEFGV